MGTARKGAKGASAPRSSPASLEPLPSPLPGFSSPTHSVSGERSLAGVVHEEAARAWQVSVGLAADWPVCKWVCVCNLGDQPEGAKAETVWKWTARPSVCMKYVLGEWAMFQK